MSSCPHCGDRWAHGEVHNCWVLGKTWSQEKLAAPVPTDFAMLGRRVETDTEWAETHGV